jgi:methionine synthase II (cobalamin-independent)
MIAIAEKTVQVQAVHHIRARRLRIEFSDGKISEVDFEPFLRAATHPAIRRYLQPRRFKQFAITDGVLQWNDFDLIFPMADLYDGVIR